MKNLKITLAVLFAFALAMPLSAQDKGQKKEEKKVVIIKKKMENGEETTEEIILTGKDAEEFEVEEILEREGIEGSGKKIIRVEVDDEKGAKKGEQKTRIMVIEEGEEMPEEAQKLLDEMDIDINIDAQEGSTETQRIKIITVDDDGNKEVMEWEGDGDIPADIQKKMQEKGMKIEIEEEHEVKKIRKIKNTNGGFLGVILRKEVNNDNGVETITGESEAGVVVDGISEGSAAEAAKLEKGDIITAIDGKKITKIDALTAALNGKKVGEKVAIDYTRNGKAASTTATLQARPSVTKMKNTWTDEDGNTIELEGEDGTKTVIKKKIIVIEEDENGKKKKKKKEKKKRKEN